MRILYLMLSLPTVTLITVCTTRDHDEAAHAMTRSQRGVDFRNVVVLTDRPEAFKSVLRCEIIEIPPFADHKDLCPWFLTESHKVILPLIGSHLLSIHYDGFLVNPDAWEPEFLDYDYIGAPMWGTVNGNGGCTLRSRKLHENLPKLNIPPTQEACYPSDQKLCLWYRPRLEELGVKWAPIEMAARFGIENAPWTGHCTFHGKDSLAEIKRMGLYD